MPWWAVRTFHLSWLELEIFSAPHKHWELLSLEISTHSLASLMEFYPKCMQLSVQTRLSETLVQIARTFLLRAPFLNSSLNAQLPQPSCTTISLLKSASLPGALGAFLVLQYPEGRASKLKECVTFVFPSLSCHISVLPPLGPGNSYFMYFV
jgi:hypothetical protein